MLKIAILNHTGDTDNIGCRSVDVALDRIIKLYLKSEITTKLPVGYWSDYFKYLSPKSRTCILYDKKDLPQPRDFTPDLDLKEWDKCSNVAMQDDKHLDLVLEQCDILLVNGEGSIHHNFPRALSILSICKIAKKRGVKVILLNSTIQSMSAELLRDVLPAIDFIHVREPKSHQFLRGLGIHSVCGPDLAFEAISDLFQNENLNATQKKSSSSKKRTLVSLGVLNRPESIKSVCEIAIGLGLEVDYLSMGDGNEDAVSLEACSAIGVKVIRASEIALDDLPGILRNYDLAISGRHHLNLFLTLAHIPFVPLPSNTWKIDGTLQQLKYPIKPACNMLDLRKELVRLLNKNKKYRRKTKKSSAIGLKLTKKFIKELQNAVN